MTAPTLVLAHLYPAEMNIYGDRGNVLALRRRLEWRGIGVRVVDVGPGDPFDLREADLLFGGGGQDAGQVIVAADLQDRGDTVIDAVDDGVVLLAICGTYQLLGRRFVTAEGDDLPGIGLFDLETVAGPPGDRLIGNVVIDSPFGRLVGFENHGGRTHLAAGQDPLGQVVAGHGHGNNGRTGDEGAIRHNAIGTYLHGPLLPKNPRLADELLLRALRRHGIEELAPLDDSIELAAATAAARRPQ